MAGRGRSSALRVPRAQLGLEGGAEALAGIGGAGIPGGTGQEVSFHSGRAISPRAPPSATPIEPT